MAPTIDISIPTTSNSTTSKPYTIYNITIRQPLRSHNVQKRYSDFEALHHNIRVQASNAPPPAPLPGKSWFKSTISSAELTEERRRGLETYLRSINAAEDGRWRKTEAWRQFLNLPPGGGSLARTATGQPAASSARGTDVGQTSIVDPIVWLDVHRELKAQLGAARQALRRRTESNTAQMQHEAGAEVKRYLVRSGTTIAALEAGLQRLTEQAQAPKRARGIDEHRDSWGSALGEGEIRRRRDLLSGARKERDAMELQLMSLATKPAADGSTGAAATAAQKNALFNASAGAASNRGGAGRRVLGGHAKETERTRELDNEGVLQLQKQIMHEQDSDVGGLTHTVRRMKEMGMQINNELVYQNEMLGTLGQDVDRMQDKINVAKKRVGQIS